MDWTGWGTKEELFAIQGTPHMAVVVCLPGAWTEHVTERIEQAMDAGKGGYYISSHRDNQRGIYSRARSKRE